MSRLNSFQTGAKHNQVGIPQKGTVHHRALWVVSLWADLLEHRASQVGFMGFPPVDALVFAPEVV